MITSIRIFILILLLPGFGAAVLAQYPTITDDVKKASEAYQAAAKKKAMDAFEAAGPIMEKEALEGRPYIPWAERPTDLPQASIPAFPGAEGGGMYSFGGRGGKVIVVNSLEDEGPGTLREACYQGGARIVVFNVSGIIRLKSPLYIYAPYITIAGQTAPGDGVCVAGETFAIMTHDVVIRHMRFRRGETWVGRRDDAIGGNPVGNIMIDHVSASWGLDENMSMYRHNYDPGDGSKTKKLPTVNLSIQNSIFAEALDTYNHSFGSTLGGENCSFSRNLWANNAGRNPSIGWNGIFNFCNNVVYNWYHRSVDGGDHTALYNIINNYYKPGPVTPLDKPISYRILKPESRFSMNGKKVYGRAHVSGNIVEGNEKVTADNWAGGVQIEGNPVCDESCDRIRWDKPFPMPPLTIMPAEEAYAHVLDHAGAILPRRDKVDERIILQVRTNEVDPANYTQIDTLYQFRHRRLGRDSWRYGIITDPAQLGGYPSYEGKARKDSDMDGMPDWWEKKHGLDPEDPSDATGDMNDDGYTNIERYINGIDPQVKVDWTDLNNNVNTLTAKDLEKH